MRRRKASSLYQLQKPKTAKKLYFDVIPKAVDEYLTFLDKYREADAGGSSSKTRSGTSMAASRRRNHRPCPSPCC